MARRKATTALGAAQNALIAKAFVIGVVIAVLLGLFGTMSVVAAYRSTLLSLLVLAGLVVGFFNISKEETHNYLLATVSLVIVASLGGSVLGKVDMIGMYLISVFDALMAFIVPAVIVVSLKAVYNLSKD